MVLRNNIVTICYKPEQLTTCQVAYPYCPHQPFCQYARKYAIEFIAKRELTERLLDWRISKG